MGYIVVEMVVNAVLQDLIVDRLLVRFLPTGLKGEIVDSLGDFFQVVNVLVAGVVVHGEDVDVVDPFKRVRPLFDGVGSNLRMQEVTV